MKSEAQRRNWRQRASVAGRIGVVALALIGASGLRSSAVEDPDQPGLPKPPNGQWMVPRATALTYTPSAKQWVRTPAIQAIVASEQAFTQTDYSCGRLFPYESKSTYKAHIYFVSPNGAPAKYGYEGPFTVRTAAFGTIPVEAKVRLRQPRDADNLPIGITASQIAVTLCPGSGPHTSSHQSHDKAILETTASGPVQAEILSLSVDGVIVELSGTCRTSSSTLELSAPPVSSVGPFAPGEDPYAPASANLMTTPYFTFTQGGLLTGKVDLPAFSGCMTTDGEDMSALLTATVSGPDNVVRIRSEALSGGIGSSDCWQSRACAPLSDLPIPASPPAE